MCMILQSLEVERQDRQEQDADAYETLSVMQKWQGKDFQEQDTDFTGKRKAHIQGSVSSKFIRPCPLPPPPANTFELGARVSSLWSIGIYRNIAEVIEYQQDNFSKQKPNNVTILSYIPICCLKFFSSLRNMLRKVVYLFRI